MRKGLVDGSGNRFPVPSGQCGIAPAVSCLASLSLDYIARQKIASTAVKCFAFKQLPILPPSAYFLAAIEFIVPRVLELTFTAGDIRPFADDVWKAASPQLRQSIASQWEENRDAVAGAVPCVASPVAAIHLSPFRSQFPDTPETSDREGFPFSPFIWDEHRRMKLRAELDAFYARLYGLTRKQLRYVLDPADLTEMELRDIYDPHEEVEDPLDASGYRARVAASTFPRETFRVLKRKEEKLLWRG